MMDWTDRHCRYFHRVLSKGTDLYTEMLTAQAIIHGDRERLLAFNPSEHPVVLQIGSSDANEVADAAKIGIEAGYDGVNLNVGCPSDRVQSGAFGAVLMKNPKLVRDCLSSMAQTIGPERVSVKCRLGVDDQDVEKTLPIFLKTIEKSGVCAVTIHARKAWLKGLSPKENRDVPPLDYDLALSMLQQFPELQIGINGGITDLGTASELLDQGFHSVMIGRAAYHDPGNILLAADPEIHGTPAPVPDRQTAVLAMLPYIEQQLTRGERLNRITRHMLGLFLGMPGARHWRRILSEKSTGTLAGPEVVLEALSQIEMRAA